MTELGRLERVELRNVWKNEAHHFTPWLAQPENLTLLADTLGMELEVEAVEQNVGPFRADILCKDVANGTWVLIENQLERTDHNHLGQLITYAAGLDAVTIVWVAAKVADEHRKACDWLNEVTSDSLRFFALEVELWRIGQSLAAPKFNVVSQPNAWGSTVSAAQKALESGELSETRQMQVAYWTEMERLLASRTSAIKTRSSVSGSWVSHGIGRTGFSLNTSMNTFKKRVRVELYLSGQGAKANFAALYAKKDEIEAKTGQLEWLELPDRTDSLICLPKPNSDPFDRADWVHQHDWLVETLLKFNATFRPLISSLNVQIEAPK